MKPYQNILLATDFSQQSELAAERAKDIASHYGASLQVIHIVEEVILYTEDIDMMMGSPFYENDQLLELAQERMKKFAENAGFSDDVTQTVEWGHPKSAVLSWAEDNDIDLIIMGAHGHHGIERLLGSVSNGISHQSKCDTLLVRS